MAKKSKIAKNEKRQEIVARYAARRAELNEIVRRPSSTEAERAAAQEELRTSAAGRERHPRTQPRQCRRPAARIPPHLRPLPGESARAGARGLPARGAEVFLVTWGGW